MPAYRSPSEGEIRDAVVARIRLHRPNARIIHEINASGQGSNRIDLLAVDRAEIIAVEIKSAKDKLDRLPAQMKAMEAVAHHAIAAVHEKFLVEQVTNRLAAHSERDGQFFMKALPQGIRDNAAWVYPEKRRAMLANGFDSIASWRFPATALDTALPAQGLDLLWRDELHHLCGALRIAVGRRATMGDMTRLLRWHCTGKELTRGICAMLRARRCVEADPEIMEKAA